MIFNPTIYKSGGSKTIPVTITIDLTAAATSIVCYWIDAKGELQSKEIYGSGETVQMVENTLFGFVADFSAGGVPSMQNAEVVYPGTDVVLCLAQEGAIN